MRRTKLFLECLVLLFIFIFSTTSYSMLCPTNFNAIEFGYTMDQVIQLCGSPSQRSEYKETIKVSTNNAGDQIYGSYSQSHNNYYLQSRGNSQQINDEKEAVIIHTRLIYGNPQPTALLFENGILKNREILH